ncbi:MAG: hypothetical protein BMS9Abin31_0631 [Gammaproteobacteria bacterium]|nr:MAG: hypothetical protein BMS9Abin31_0631 [Gammaproteobacteria bacterium]
MAQVKNLTLTGASRRTFSFQAFPWGTKFNPSGAVYAILKQTPTGHYSVIYIGQTSDLSKRFENHHQQECFDRNGKSHIAVYPVSGESRRFDIETDLLRSYKPVCND